MNTAGSMFAGLKVRGQIRFTPTPKMRIEPTRPRLSRAACVITGCNRVDVAVTSPCHAPTGSAEKTTPFPMDAAIAQMHTASMAPLSARVV